MKKLYILILLLATCAFAVNAQTLFLEDFSGGMPPAGWSIDQNATNWSAGNSANAGGTAPEATFAWTPSFVGESYLISSPVDLTGYTIVGFSFLQMVDHYGGPYTLGVATRSGGGAWTTVWEVVDPPASIEAEEVDITISNSDVGQVDFEICFFFSGDSYNINYWFFDNAKLYVPFDHDAATKKILGDTYYDAGDNYTAEALIKNAGLNDEEFDVILEIFDGITNDLLYTETKNISLSAGTETTVAFSAFTLPDANLMYDVVVATALDGDMDPSNDMKNKYIYTYTSERNMVVVEIGTGTWCVFCPGAAMGADDLIDNGYNVAIMENHNGDAYTTPDSDARNAYYGITGYPTAVFDGVTSFVGGSNTASMYTNYVPIVEGRQGIMSAFSCNIYGGSTGGNDYTVLAIIDKLAPAMNANVVLQVGLTESHIQENWQGQDHLNFVSRLMMPDASGTVVDVINNDHIEVEHSFTMDETWDINECELVYFLQDNDTKEILQGGKVMVNDLIGVGIEEDLEQNGIAIHNIYPNPFTNTTNINFSIASTENVQLIIHDMTGREVAILADEVMIAGDHQITWEAGSDVPNGIYFCTLKTAEHTLTQKVMLSK